MVRLLPELCCKRHCELSAMFRDLDVIRVQLLEEVEGPFTQKCEALAAEADAAQAALAQLRTEHEQLLQQHKHLVGVHCMQAVARQPLSCADPRVELLLYVTAMLHYVARWVAGHIGYAGINVRSCAASCVLPWQIRARDALPCTPLVCCTRHVFISMVSAASAASARRTLAAQQSWPPSKPAAQHSCAS
jgi:hypothetical protein